MPEADAWNKTYHELKNEYRNQMMWKYGSLIQYMLLVCYSSLTFFCVVLLCAFTFWLPSFDVRYDFGIKTMFGSSLLPVVCRGFMFYLRYLCLIAHSGVQHILCCAFCLCFFVLCTLCCQFLWIVRFLLSVFSHVHLLFTT